MIIRTKQNYIDHYCKAFSLSPCDDHGLNTIVYSKAMNCPICGSKPALYCVLEKINTGTIVDKEVISAGVVMCGCGKSGMYFDERNGGAPHPEKLLEPTYGANKLTDTWNGIL